MYYLRHRHPSSPAPWVVGRLEGFQFPLDRMTLLYSIKSIAALYTIFSVLGRTQKVIRVKKGRVKKVFDHHCIALVFPRRSTTKTTTRLGTRLSNTSMASAAPSSQPLHCRGRPRRKLCTHRRRLRRRRAKKAQGIVDIRKPPDRVCKTRSPSR